MKKSLIIFTGVLLLAATASAWQSSWWNSFRSQILEPREQVEKISKTKDLTSPAPTPVPAPTPITAPTPIMDPAPVVPVPTPTPPGIGTAYSSVTYPALASNYVDFDTNDQHSNGRKGSLRFGAVDKEGYYSTGVLIRFPHIESGYYGAASITFTIEGYVPLHLKRTDVSLEAADFDWDVDSTLATLPARPSTIAVGTLTPTVSVDPVKKLTKVTLSGSALATLAYRWNGGLATNSPLPESRGIYLTLGDLGLDDGEIIVCGAFSKHPPYITIEVDPLIQP